MSDKKYNLIFKSLIVSILTLTILLTVAATNSCTYGEEDKKDYQSICYKSCFPNTVYKFSKSSCFCNPVVSYK